MNSTYPSDNTSWLAAVDNNSSHQLGFTVYVVCAPADSVTP